MKRSTQIRISLAIAITFIGGLLVYAWTPLPVKQDRLLFMPGSQPGSVALESANRCDNCHGGYNKAVEPAHNWRGGMMANAARDPLWAACLTVALQDSIWALGNPNAGDLCIRCHTPTGWLAGHSDPPNLTALVGSDFEGVSCDACHKMVDPVRGLRQTRDLAAETAGTTAATEANKTYTQDYSVLAGLALFDGALFFDAGTDLPRYFGNGALPNYIESTSGQYFMDNSTPKRGPRWDADPKHQWYYSRFHKTKYFCGTCHDVSNPVLGRLLSGDMALPEKQAAASYVHVERTFSEFMLSAYGQPGGATVNPKINLPAGTKAAKCQDCHMRDVTGTACNKAGIQTRTDLALHDQTGGNAWISGILASADMAGTTYDAYNYAILSGAKYPGAKIDVAGIQGYGQALLDGQSRARQQLQMAADLIVVGETASDVTLRIVNNTGHKLTSGFPEGRRMWLNVKFLDAAGALVDEINPYDNAGHVLHKTRDDLVYEAEMSSSLTAEEQSFHFVLATSRHKDNRIPPKGFDIANAAARNVQPRWNGADAPDYFTAAEYAGGYDEVVIAKPAGAASWSAALYYQTTSKEYVEFLRDQIDAGIAQTDPFFSTLKDWGKAIYDLWLHNGGAAPVLLASVGVTPPCTPPAIPAGLTATAAKKGVKLAWSAVTGATSYNVYYAQGGKYALRATVTTPSYTDTGLKPGQTYCYAVTAANDCESGYSNTACAVPTR